jgi:hypothetical protein
VLHSWVMTIIYGRPSPSFNLHFQHGYYCMLWLFYGIQKYTAMQSSGDCSWFEQGIEVIDILNLNLNVRDCFDS